MAPVAFLVFGQISQIRLVFAGVLGSSQAKSRPCSAKPAHHADWVLYLPSEDNVPRWLDTCPRYPWRYSYNSRP